jgi:hypothetical protein
MVRTRSYVANRPPACTLDLVLIALAVLAVLAFEV